MNILCAIWFVSWDFLGHYNLQGRYCHIGRRWLPTKPTCVSLFQQNISKGSDLLLTGWHRHSSFKWHWQLSFRSRFSSKWKTCAKIKLWSETRRGPIQKFVGARNDFGLTRFFHQELPKGFFLIHFSRTRDWSRRRRTGCGSKTWESDNSSKKRKTLKNVSIKVLGGMCALIVLKVPSSNPSFVNHHISRRTLVQQLLMHLLFDRPIWRVRFLSVRFFLFAWDWFVEIEIGLFLSNK